MLTIRNAKFGKSRLIPLHRSTLKALKTFLQHRDRFFARLNPQPEASHLFVTSRGSRLERQTYKSGVPLHLAADWVAWA